MAVAHSLWLSALILVLPRFRNRAFDIGIHYLIRVVEYVRLLSWLGQTAVAIDCCDAPSDFCDTTSASSLSVLGMPLGRIGGCRMLDRLFAVGTDGLVRADTAAGAGYFVRADTAISDVQDFKPLLSILWLRI
ncbi:hypothetical protein B0T21DRAFT_377394 [Apiosordaria backusii]|uniref:Secreted protein n=1 Tax=Apiosordaria backusii TaxID=314023 RepID=A0AA40A0X2_9PEZI|nr:hypothetical protein B0T21DRAFT_377394 [Apiosordaria backusii]